MPSGPKKRRAARRKRGAGTHPNGEEEEFDAAGELSAVHNVSEMSCGDMKLEAHVDKTSSKESQSLDQIALKSPPLQDVPVVEECDSVGSNGKKESEHESVHDEIIMHAPVMESVITKVESSDSVENKEKEPEFEPVDQVLIQPSSKETKGNEDTEVGEGAMETVITKVESSDSVENKEKESESEPVDQVLIQPSSKETKGNEDTEVGEGAFHGAMETVITKVESSDSVENKEKESEFEPVDQVLIQPSSEETKGNEDTEVGEGAFHGAMETVDRGFSVVKESEEISKEGVLQDPIKEPNVGSSHQPQAIVDTVDQLVPKALPLQEAQDLTVPTESVSEVNLETFVEDSVKEPPGSSSLVNVSADHEGIVQENEGVEIGESAPAMVKDVSVVKNEGEDMSMEGICQDPSEETSESSSHEPQAMVKTVDELVLKPIRIKEAQDPSVPVESDIEVELESISFEDAEESFETPLGSPSIGYMSPVIPLNEAQDPYLTAEFVAEVNVHASLKEDQDSFIEPDGSSSLVDVSPVEGVVEENEVAKVGESACHDEPVLKEHEEISMESVLKEPLGELLDSSSHEVVKKTVDELITEAIPLEEAQDPSLVAESVIEENVETYAKDAKDSFQEPVESLSLTDVSLEEEVDQGNVCAVGECACDCALINHVVPEGEKMSLEGVREDSFEEPTGNSSHEPQEIVDKIDRSLVEGFVQFNGHWNEPIGLSSHEQQVDVTSVEGAFNHVPVLKEDEEMPIEGVLEERCGFLSDELQAIIKTPDQEIPLKEDRDPSIPGDAVSEANVETFLKDDQVNSFKVSHVEGNEYEEVGDSATLVNPFVLGMEEDEEISVDEGELDEPFEEPIEPSSDEQKAMVKMVDNSILEVIPSEDADDHSVPGESLSEANVETSIKDAQESFKEPTGDFSMDDVLCMDHGQQVMVNHVESVMKENEDMSMVDVLEEPISRSLDEPQPMVKKVDQDLSTQAESIIKVNIDASFEVAQDSFKVPLGDSSTDDVSHVEGDVQENRFIEVGDQSESHGQPAMVKSVELVMEDEELSMKGPLEEPFEEPISLSSPEPQTMVKTVNQSVLKEAQVASVPGESAIEVYVDTTFIDDQDSFKDKGHESAVMVNHVDLVMEENEEMSIEGGHTLSEQEVIVKTIDQSILKEAQDPSLQSESVNDVLPIEGVVQGNGISEVIESACHSSPTMVNHAVSVLKDGDGEMSMEGVLQDPFKDPTEQSLHEPEAVIKTIDQLVLKKLHFKEIHDPSVIEVNVDTSFEDAQESFETPLGSPSVAHVSPVEGFAQWNDDRNESIVHSSHEPRVMVKTVDQSVPEATALKEAQDPSVSVESVIEANVETPLTDAKDFPIDSPGSFSLADVSSTEGVEENECAEVGESAVHGPPAMVDHVVSVLKDEKEVSMEGGLQERFKAEIGPSDEPEVMVKTIDQLFLKAVSLTEVQDPSVQAVSVIEVNVERSLEDAQDSSKESLGSPSLDKVTFISGNAHLDGYENEPIERSSQETQLEMVKTDDHKIPLEEAQDPLLPRESVIEANVVEAFSKDAHVSSKKGDVQGNRCDEVGESACDGVFVLKDEEMSMKCVLEEPLEELTELSSDELQAMMKTADQVRPLEEVQDPSLPVGSVTDENVETSLKDVQDSFKEPLGTTFSVDVSPPEGDVEGKDYYAIGVDNAEMVNHFEPIIMENEEMSIIKGVLEEPFEEPTQAIVKTDDQSVIKGLHLKDDEDSSVPADSVIKVNVDTSFEYAQDSFETPPGSPLVGHVSPFEGFAELNEPVGHSSHEPHVMDKTVDQVVSKEIPLDETLEPSLPAESVIEANVEKSLKDAKDSSIESLRSLFMADVSSMEGVVQGNESAEVGENAFQGPLLMVNHVVSVSKDDEEVSMEGVLQESFKEPIGSSSDELQTIVNTVDFSVIDPSVPGESVFEANLDTSLKDFQDSFKEPLVSSCLVFVSPVVGVVQGKECADGSENARMVNHFRSLKENEDFSVEGANREPFEKPVGDSLHEQEAMVGITDRSLLKEIPLKEAEDPSVPVESFIKVNVETPFKDAQESLGSFVMADVSSMESVVRGNESAEVGENAFQGPPLMVNHVSVLKDDKEVSMEGVLEESSKEPIGSSSDELQTVVKTVDLSVQDPSVPGVVQEKECAEGSENARMVNHVESLKKENEDLSLEGVTNEPFEKSVEDSSHQQEAMVDTIDRSLLKEIPLKEAEDPYVPVESFIKVNVETPFKDAQESVPLGSPSLVDVYPVGGIVQGDEFDNVGQSACHGSPMMENHGSSSLVNGSLVEGVGQRNGQRNEMVGLVRTLLEEIRRIRAFYEEGLRQTTKIDLQILQVLEKFESDEII